ncbi:hypothetical protein [Caballeronia sordidicola]|uniref:hypothetical protein n=1 Tax=Caballeronia sordidicola TaxID=196367 RepID=UPI000A386168|nr:hypothetical protein [Caballeronia sordidicola]
MFRGDHTGCAPISYRSEIFHSIIEQDAGVARGAATLESFRPKGLGKKTPAAIAAYEKDFASYAKQNDVESVINYAGRLPEASLKVDQLHQFLVDNIEQASSAKNNVTTNFFKLVCIYDLLQFKQL